MSILLILELQLLLLDIFLALSNKKSHTDTDTHRQTSKSAMWLIDHMHTGNNARQATGSASESCLVCLQHYTAD